MCSRSRSVEIRVVNVTQILIIRVGVYRGHQAVLYAYGLVERRNDGREAISRA